MPYLSIDRDLPSQVMEVGSYCGQSPCTVYLEDIRHGIDIEPDKLNILETMLSDATPDSPVFLGIRISIEGTLFFPSTASILIDPNIEDGVIEDGYYWLDTAQTTLDESMLCYVCELDIEPGYMIN